MKYRKTKTDYRRRLKLLKSNLDRLVVRKTNHYIIGQIIRYDEKGDRTLTSVNSKDLKKFGWDLGLKNVVAAYLTGYLIGKKSDVKEAVVDKGNRILHNGSFIRYFEKGAIDAGMDLHTKELEVDENRKLGKHILEYYEKNASKNQFSILKDKVKYIVDEFNKVIQQIDLEYGRRN